MPFSLIPHRVVDRYAEITPAYLHEQGVTLLLSDLDFYAGAQVCGPAGPGPAGLDCGAGTGRNHADDRFQQSLRPSGAGVLR